MERIAIGSKLKVTAAAAFDAPIAIEWIGCSKDLGTYYCLLLFEELLMDYLRHSY